MNKLQKGFHLKHDICLQILLTLPRSPPLKFKGRGRGGVIFNTGR
jgi:hypothetical protein